MNEADIIDIGREAILVMTRIAGPTLLVGLLVGVLVSLIQTVTQIQEATLAFVPKLACIGLMLLVSLPFMVSTLTSFAEGLAGRIVAMAPPSPPQTHGT